MDEVIEIVKCSWAASDDSLSHNFRNPKEEVGEDRAKD